MINLINNIQGAIVLTIVIVILAVYSISLYKKYKTQGKDVALEELRGIAYRLFLAAEEKFGEKTGVDKMAWVVTNFYSYLMPNEFEKLLPNTTVEKFLQDVFTNYYKRLKDYLDDGQINGTVKTEE